MQQYRDTQEKVGMDRCQSARDISTKTEKKYKETKKESGKLCGLYDTCNNDGSNCQDLKKRCEEAQRKTQCHEDEVVNSYRYSQQLCFNTQNNNLTTMMLILSSPEDLEGVQAEMDTFYKEFEREFYNYDEDGEKAGLKNRNFVAPSKGQFWQAYRISLNTIRRALEGDGLNPGNHYYQYNHIELKEIAKQLVDNIKALKNSKNVDGGRDFVGFTRKSAEMLDHSGSILGITAPASNQEKAARSSAHKLGTSIAKLIEPKSQLSEWREKEGFYEVMDDINKLAMTMTSAGLVFDLYLQSNPLFFPSKRDCLNQRQKFCEDKTKTTITIIPDGDEYLARLYQVTTEDIEPLVEAAAQPIIVENTSREHVVEIADTAKINTLLSAAIQGNEVSEQLGLTLGAELAAAVSSSSAFIKRIPYAVPINGQDSGKFKDNQKSTQTFGWRYYKTPAGVTQLGGIAQAFKTTPLNSSVVVTMPEWMSTLTAEYQIAPDGDSDWEPFGSETIALSGAAIRGALSDSKMHSFDTWVKYHIYKEVDGAVGLPVMKSCIAENAKKKVGLEGGDKKKVPIISGSRGGEMAICGENLYGVKGIIVGGQYIHGELQKVSSNLMYLKTNRFKTVRGDKNDEINRCSVGNNTGDDNKCRPECEIALLSDFGVSNDAVGCLQFVSVADEVEPSVATSKAEGRFSVSGDKDSKQIIFTISRFREGNDITHYRFVRPGEESFWVPWDDNNERTAHRLSTDLSGLVNKCIDIVEEKTCAINLEVLVKPIGISSSNFLLDTVTDIYDYFNPYNMNRELSSDDTGKVIVKNNPYFTPTKVLVGDKRLERTIDATKHFFSITLDEAKEYCSGTTCSFAIKYNKIEGEFSGEIDITALLESETRG